MKTIKRVGNKDFLITSLVVVLIFAGAAGTAVYLRATAPPDDGSYLPGHQEITPEIELLQEYVRIETVSGREIEGARFLIDQLEAAGIEAELIVSGEGRGNVYARLEGRTQGEGLLLLHHIDVRPASDEGWTRPPFSGDVYLNRIYGRGVLDMKGVGIAQMLAFIEASKLEQPLERDLVLLAVADEEDGSVMGMQWLLRNRPDLFEGVQYVLNEGGITEMVRDEIQYYAVETAGKQIRQYRVVAPDQEAISELRERWNEYLLRPEMELLTDEVEDYFRRIAPHRNHFGPLLADIRTVEAEGRLKDLHPSYLSLLQNNIALAPERETEEGTYETTAVLWYLPGYDPADLIAEMEGDARELGVELTLSPVSSDGVVGFSSTENPFFEILSERVRAQYGEGVDVGPMIGSKGVTDCRFLRKQGIDCYGIWPFPVTVYDSAGIHGVEERLRLDWFLDGVELITGLVLDWVT